MIGTCFLVLLLLVVQHGAADAELVFVESVGMTDGLLVRMEVTKSRRVLGIQMLFMVDFEVNVGFMHFGSGGVGGLNAAGLAPGLRLVLVLVVLQVGRQGCRHLPQLNPIHTP